MIPCSDDARVQPIIDTALTPETEAFYRLFPSEGLVALRQAWASDRQRAEMTIAYCEARIDLVNRILFERRPRRS